MKNFTVFEKIEKISTLINLQNQLSPIPNHPELSHLFQLNSPIWDSNPVKLFNYVTTEIETISLSPAIKKVDKDSVLKKLSALLKESKSEFIEHADENIVPELANELSSFTDTIVENLKEQLTPEIVAAIKESLKKDKPTWRDAFKPLGVLINVISTLTKLPTIDLEKALSMPLSLLSELYKYLTHLFS